MATGWYKWMLRKGSRKEVCPACGHRRFVPFVAAADGKTIAVNDKDEAIYGRCDREDNCGYFLYPSNESTDHVTPAPARHVEPLRFHTAAVKTDTRTLLFEYAAKLLGVADAMAVWQTYCIGKDGARTVFWQIANDGSVRAGKSIPYLANGHRNKEDKLPASWLHKSRAWDAYRYGEELQQCFFGEHLLREREDEPVMIVESEKTAAMMSALSPNFVWLACGGSQGLKNEAKNEVLRGRDVRLLPDNGQYWNWRATADKYGWKCYDALEQAPLFQGCDILDYCDAGIFKKKLL